MDPLVLTRRVFEPRMLFLKCRSKCAGNSSRLFTYEIPNPTGQT